VATCETQLRVPMLTGRLPYGAQVAKTITQSQQRKLRYVSALDDTREIPAWLDAVLKKAVQPSPLNRFDELSELVFNLRRPGKAFLSPLFTPLMERAPCSSRRQLHFASPSPFCCCSSAGVFRSRSRHSS
jgi:hypothetical protein